MYVHLRHRKWEGICDYWAATVVLYPMETTLCNIFCLHNYSRGGERGENIVVSPSRLHFVKLQNSEVPHTESQNWSLESAYGNGSHSNYTVHLKADFSRPTCLVNHLRPHCVSYLDYSITCKFHGGVEWLMVCIGVCPDCFRLEVKKPVSLKGTLPLCFHLPVSFITTDKTVGATFPTINAKDVG